MLSTQGQPVLQEVFQREVDSVGRREPRPLLLRTQHVLVRAPPRVVVDSACAGFSAHVDADWSSRNALDAKALEMTGTPDAKALEDLLEGTPVSFMYSIDGSVGGARKSGVGRVHSRQSDGSFTVDMANGGRRKGVVDIRRVDEAVLDSTMKSLGENFHTHVDADLSTRNAPDAKATLSCPREDMSTSTSRRATSLGGVACGSSRR